MATPRAPTIGGGRFVLDSRLGDGGQAAVFRARDVKLGVTRALKIMLPRFASKAKVRARFSAEARAMAQLEHKNIVRVYDVETDSALPYLVMELVPSGSLANWLETYGAFPAQQAVHVALQICAGADCAHAANIVHRDIKPQNVLVAQDGTCKLTDFGIARFEDSNQTRMGASMGTEGYMAPEQARDASTVDVRSDVYGIAMTLFVLATGNDPVEWLSGRGRDQLPEALRDVITIATSPDPDDRYPSAYHLAEALEQALEALPHDAHELPLGDALPVRSVDTEDSPESYVDVAALVDVMGQEPASRSHGRATPPPRAPAEELDMGMPSFGPPPPARAALRGSGSVVPAATPEPYRMSRPVSVESEQTPDYVDRGSKADAPKPFVVGLKPLEPGSDEPRSEDSSEQSLVSKVIWWVLPPIVPVVVGCALMAVAYGAYENLSARRAVEDMEVSREHMHVELTSQRAVIDSVVSLGGDRGTLEQAYREWMSARGEPQRSSAAVRFVQSLETEAERVAAPGSVSWEEVNTRVRRLRNARDGYTESHETAVSSTQSSWVIGAAEL